MPDLRRLEHPRRDGRPRTPTHGHGRVGARPLGRRAASLADVGDADAPRLPVGIGEIDRVLGGGLVAGIARPRRRRARHRQVHAPAPGRGRPRGRVAATGGQVLYATGEESAAQVRLRAGRLGLLGGPAGDAVRVLAESEIGRIAEVTRRDRPVAAHRRLDPDGDRRRARRARRQRRPGPRGRAPPDGAGQGRRDRGGPRRPRDQGRLDRRTEDPRAPRRRRARPRRRALVRRCACCAPPRTGSDRPRRSASSRWASSD